MEQRQVQFEKQTVQKVPLRGTPVSLFPVVPRQTGDAASFIRTECSFCRQSFVLEVERHWNRPPEEMELEGRRFLGIREESVLCPECVGDVEVAGAERMYWALSHSL